MLVVGLGNPGPKYETHRHNIGFQVVDALARREGAADFKDKFSGAFAKAGSLALLKPQTFMNLSGDSVQPCAAFLKEAVEDVLVVHDELDLPFGTLRLKKGGGHAGHNGLRSLITRLGSPEFVRLRFGIGRPPPTFQGDVAAFVLSSFSAEERSRLSALVDRAVDMARDVGALGLAAAMNRWNTAP